MVKKKADKRAQKAQRPTPKRDVDDIERAESEGMAQPQDLTAKKPRQK
jgi:hypothetical protein